MRQVSVFIVFSAISTMAFAQDAYRSDVKRTVITPDAVVTTPAPASTMDETIAEPGTVIDATRAPAKEEIGYDAKVKRDPYGKAIGSSNSITTEPKTEFQKLRRDGAGSLRSDRNKYSPQQEEEPVRSMPPTVVVTDPTRPVIVDQDVRTR